MKDGSTFVCGVDIGDKYSEICVLDQEAEVVEVTRIRTTPKGFKRYFSGKERMRVALEVGTHSPWISRLLADLGQEAMVANARKLRMIYDNDRKCDSNDAELIARVARMDPKLLAPISHRGADSQAMLAVVRSRDILVQARVRLINHVRGAVKSFGERMPSCSAETFHKHTDKVPEQLRPALLPVMEEIRALTGRIREYERGIKRACQEEYSETQVLQSVPGVGPVTSLAYVLTLEDPSRFKKSRSVGAYLGFVPRLDQTGATDPQLPISKAGDSYLRRLLVGCAHYILGPFGPDTDLRRWGLKLAQRGGKNAKKRAAVAVGRKLAVLLHHLWKTGDTYEPSRQQPGRRGRRRKAQE
jgi:transposase